MTVIKIENLWKEYRLGVIGHGTLTHDMQSWWAKVRGKDDPNSQVTAVMAGQEKQIEGNRFWALRDINFEIKQGDVLGIIGKNGAGKSTLLKILSRVTAPTIGDVKIRGRIASLLEVGTGFHPELTGRENIFMNGAILGMSKQEIRAKLDEIIDFSGVEQYIDTPVKRYSSGMRVRLAFSVAAHLEPEILVVDEVLAVGDASFQKKCISKMSEVSSGGRTILFVSHNMNSIRKLCNECLWLDEGQLKNTGATLSIIDDYLSIYDIENRMFDGNISREMHSSNQEIIDFEIYKIEIIPSQSSGFMSVCYDEDYEIRLSYKINKSGNYYLGILFHNMNGDLLAGTASRNQNICIGNKIGDVGCISIKISNTMVPGKYRLKLLVKCEQIKIDEINGIPLTVEEVGLSKKSDPGWGVARIQAKWEIFK